MPPPAAHSEWAAAAVLRSRWSRKGAQLSLAYPDQTMRMEMRTRRHTLASGEWACEVRHNGRPLAPRSDWEELCWFSDRDVDYLELEIELADGMVLQRQVVLGREDGFVLLADALLGNEPGQLEYRACLPLCPEVAFEGASETREGFLLAAERPAALVLPLALPEWRTANHAGSLQRTARGLELVQTAEGCSLYAPLFVDLRRCRMRRRVTWRKLTVAESLEVQPDDVAVGYRVQVGKKQWLVYRSLAKRGNRTLLGHNLATEALIARFRKGEVKSLVEVE